MLYYNEITRRKDVLRFFKRSGSYLQNSWLVNTVIVLQTKNLHKYYGDNHILKNATLVINEKERVGLVGANGTGKTTLLNCISGQLEYDNGEIIKAASLSLAYLEQLPSPSEELTAWDTVMSSYSHLLELRNRIGDLEQQISQAGPDLGRLMDRYAVLTEEYERNNGYACENMARRILIGLGFRSDDFDRLLADFSGGQKTRINLGRLLALAPDLLLLDEPTNHLDMDSVEWLEDFLKDYPGTILIVSHDRWFLDRVASRIIQLANGQLKSYPGNYSNYLKLKAVEEEAEKRAYEKQQEYIKDTEEYIRRFKAGIKSKQARGRETRLERLEVLERPQNTATIGVWDLSLDYESGQDVLGLREVSKSYGNLHLFTRLDFDLYKGEKVALIGPNGCGKTTLLKIINGLVQVDEGSVRIGSRVKIAYFAQQYEDLEPANTVLEEIVSNSNILAARARSLLGRMLFRGDEVFKKVGDLSGGEKGRLAILKVLLSGANFLILDEPTNHLDIESRQAVEEMLEEYSGTVLLVSHDRYLIDRVASRVAAIYNSGLQNYAGNYSYYTEKRRQLETNSVHEQSKGNEKISEQQEFRLKQKEAERNRKMLDNRLSKLEEKIHYLEKRKDETEELMVSPGVYSDQEKAKYCLDEYENIKRELNAAYQEWEKLLEDIDSAGNQTGG